MLVWKFDEVKETTEEKSSRSGDFERIGELQIGKPCSSGFDISTYSGEGDRMTGSGVSERRLR